MYKPTTIMYINEGVAWGVAQGVARDVAQGCGGRESCQDNTTTTMCIDEAAAQERAGLG